MSLHFTLRVNGHPIYHAVDIVLLDHVVAPDPEATYRYRVCAVAEDGTQPARQYQATFTHRYGDGAFECVRLALNAIADGQGGVIRS